MTQLARNLTDPNDGFLRGVRHIILDRDPLYTTAFRRLLRDSGVTPVILPAWSPNLNAFAERFVESVKSECLDRMVLLGEPHLRAAMRAVILHYHEERPHQGLGNDIIAPRTTVIGTGRITCRDRRDHVGTGRWVDDTARAEPDGSERRRPSRRSVHHPGPRPLYTAAFRRLLRDSGVKPLVLPAWSPNLNAFAERVY